MADPLRPILLGMNNPLSRRPEHALYPEPSGCTGHRIFMMLKSVLPEISEEDYLSKFDRRNMLVGEEWKLELARHAAADIWPLTRGRKIVMLGAQVCRAMGLSNGSRAVPPLCWQTVATYGGAQWAQVPHPSGLNRWYNQPGNRAAAAAFLAELYRGA